MGSAHNTSSLPLFHDLSAPTTLQTFQLQGAALGSGPSQVLIENWGKLCLRAASRGEGCGGPGRQE